MINTFSEAENYIRQGELAKNNLIKYKNIIFDPNLKKSDIDKIDKMLEQWKKENFRLSFDNLLYNQGLQRALIIIGRYYIYHDNSTAIFDEEGKPLKQWQNKLTEIYDKVSIWYENIFLFFLYFYPFYCKDIENSSTDWTRYINNGIKYIRNIYKYRGYNTTTKKQIENLLKENQKAPEVFGIFYIINPSELEKVINENKNDSEKDVNRLELYWHLCEARANGKLVEQNEIKIPWRVCQESKFDILKIAFAALYHYSIIDNLKSVVFAKTDFGVWIPKIKRAEDIFRNQKFMDEVKTTSLESSKSRMSPKDNHEYLIWDEKTEKEYLVFQDNGSDLFYCQLELINKYYGEVKSAKKINRLKCQNTIDNF